MFQQIFSDISRVKNICEQNNLDRKDSIQILSSLIALTQLGEWTQKQSSEDYHQQPLRKKSWETFNYLNRQIHEISNQIPDHDQQSLNQIQTRLRRLLFR